MLGRLIIILSFIILTVLGIIGWIYFDKPIQLLFKPTTRETKIGVTIEKTTTPQEITTIAENLTIPWEIVFLPDNSILVTERSGQLVKIDNEQHIIPITGVEHTGEGGLLGLTLHPNFVDNKYIYLYLTSTANNNLVNRVERYQLQNTTLTNHTVIIDNIPSASYHDGGRIAFGPDHKLYITTGDAGTDRNAQDLNSLAGKILRLNDDGTIPSDNPFNTAVYSYGHRNPQGLAWDDVGNLWSTEHGRSGLKSGLDEINIITAGSNYGWPLVQGDETNKNFTAPTIHSGADDTWAPAGMTYYNGSLLFAGLRGEALYQAKLNNTEVIEVIAHFPEQFGRLRTVVKGPDNMIYITTSNQDGRGIIQEGDDKIIRIDPKLLGL